MRRWVAGALLVLGLLSVASSGDGEAAEDEPSAREPSRREPIADKADAIEITENLSLKPLASGAHVFIAQPWAANTLVVEADDGRVVLVDTPPTPIQTERILAWIAETYGARELLAVNSHHHIDASGGNQALAVAGVPIYGGALTPQEMATRSAGMLASLAETFIDDPFMSGELRGLRPTPPSRTFPTEGRLTLPLGKETLVLFHPGHAHSADNIVAWFPTRSILYGGCMVKDGDSLGYLGEANTETWPAAVEQLIALEPAFVVPGHGPRTDPGLLENTARLLREAAAVAP